MKDGTTYKQGDIVLIPFPYSDLTGVKQRPALIISNEMLNKTQDRICCLITSNETGDGITIENKHFRDRKLPFKSYVKPHRIFTVNENIIRKKLCNINNEFHKLIINKINSIIE